VVEVPESAKELLLVRQYEELDSISGKAQPWVKVLKGEYTAAIALGGHRSLSYPLGFKPFLLEASRDRALNPLLLAALVREESRYDPDACSPVGAMGLAQLMPSTAKGIDPKIGALGDRPLTDPRSNLMRGAHFLAYTRTCFPQGKDFLAVASYNAGVGAVKGWLSRFPTDDPDVFIESIPYRETRNYVRRVMESFWNYQELYGN
jgi:soluble lytic murein transglycosylase